MAVGQHTGIVSESWDRWFVVVPPLLAAVVIGNLAGASYRGRPRRRPHFAGFAARARLSDTVRDDLPPCRSCGAGVGLWPRVRRRFLGSLLLSPLGRIPIASASANNAASADLAGSAPYGGGPGAGFDDVDAADRNS